MCGICGQYDFNPENKADKELMTRMLDSINLRGPDHCEAYLRNNIGLAASILHIRDPKNSGQPFFNENRGIFSVFNGEIYNYQELREQLVKAGHKLRTNCDSELFPHLYEQYGDEFVRYLNGMFAIALFDSANNVLILARDRIGIKPLYYSLEDSRIIFASSISAVIRDRRVSRQFDSQALNCYFSLNYFPGAYTPFKYVKKLLPGHCLTVKNGRPEIKRYWQFEFIRDPVRKEQEYAEEFLAIFKQVIKDQLVSDVPLGAFLSGGLDSSGLCVYAARQVPGLKTFNVGFQESTFDEQKYLADLKPKLGENSHCCRLPADMFRLISRMSSSLDLPVGEGSYIPFYFLSEFAAENVTVALSGEGADELFGGYEQYFADIYACYYKKLPQALRVKLLETAVSLLPVDYKWMNPRFSLELFLKGIRSNQSIPHYFWREIFSAGDKQQLYAPDFLNCFNKDNPLEKPYLGFADNFKAVNSSHFLEQALFADTSICLADGMLQRVDMASMHNSLEVRVPYLDNRIIEFAQRLPLSLKIKKMQGKVILKKAFENDLPSSIRLRRKHGMSAPVSKWIKADLREFCYERFSRQDAMDHIINKRFVREMLDAHCAGSIDAGRRLWNLLIFSLWQDKLSDD